MKALTRSLRLLSACARALTAPPKVTFYSPGTLRELLVALLHLTYGRRLVHGSSLSAYEREWEAYLPTPHAVSFGSGRMSLFAILSGLGVGPGDEVIIPGFTCVVVPNAVLYAGARPVYADIEARSLNIDISDVERKLTERTKAIILSHNFGIPGDVAGAEQLAARYSVKLIEDCAHALGAKFKGRHVGTFGDAAFFSTEQSKVISSVKGGVAVTYHTALGRFLRQFQEECEWPSRADVRALLVHHLALRVFAYPRLYDLGNVVRYYLSCLGLAVDSMTPEELIGLRPSGYRSRLSNAQAALGRVQLRRVDRSNAARRRHAQQLAGILIESAGAELVCVPSDSEPTFLRYPVWATSKAKATLTVANQSFQVGSWFQSVTHPAIASSEAAGYKAGSCPVGEFAAAHVINFPTHRRFTRRQLAEACAILASTAPFPPESAGDRSGPCPAAALQP